MPETKKIPPSNPAELLGHIKKAFPDVSWSTFEYLDEGWDHEIIILDNKLVFRFPNDPEYLSLLKMEIEALRQLQSLITSVAIPQYSYVAPDYSFAGYRFIPGQALTQQQFGTLTSDERTKLAKDLAAFLSAMHTAIDAKNNFNDVPSSDMLETHARDKQLAKKYLKSSLNIDDYQLVKAILDDTDTVLSQDIPSVLLHGDIYSRHLLWDNDRSELGIIDFSDMNRGDPAFDFAELHEYGENFIQEIYGYYAGPKDSTFLNRSKTYQKWVGVFMMVDHFIHHKNSFAEARETFERTKDL